MPEYYFVVSGGHPQPADRAIRSHSMKTALHKKATRITKSDQQTQTSQVINARQVEALKGGLNGRFRLVTKPKKQKRKQQDEMELVVEGNFKDLTRRPFATSGNDAPIQATPGMLAQQPWGGNIPEESLIPVFKTVSPVSAGSLNKGYLDPFSSISIPYSPQVDMLVKYFLTKFALNASRGDTQKHWFAFSMREPLIMHTTLALAGNGWLASTPNPDPRVRQEVLRHKGLAIETINSLLSLSSISTTLIAGIANLANVAAFEGSFSEADTHIRGLKRLVNLRGGYEAFIDDPLVLRSVTWADLQAATALGRSPAFPLVYHEHMADLPQSLCEEAEFPSLDHIANIMPGGNHVKRSFMLLRRALLYSCLDRASSDVIRLHMHIADAFILHLLYDETERGLLHGPLRPLLLAAHVFLYLVMRKVPRNGAVARALLRRLEESIHPEYTDPSIWRDHLPALCWVLFVGAAASEPRAAAKHRMWSQLRDTCRVMLPATKESLADVLKTFLWSTKEYPPFLDEFWNLGLDDRSPC